MSASNDLPQAPIPEPPPAPAEESRAPDWYVPDATEELGATAARIKARATSELGTCEPAAFRKFVGYFDLGGQPAWCVYFMAWCWDTRAGHARRKTAPWKDAAYAGFGHTKNVHDWGQRTGKLRTKPLSGMLYGIEDGYQHTGLVLGANASTLEIWTINGNWGDCVKHQTWKHVRGRRWTSGSSEHTLFFSEW